MPSNLSEFEDGTGFERYVLDRAAPLLPRVAGSSVIELGDGNSTSVAVGVQPASVHVGVTDSMGSGGDQLSPDDFRPLLFGAAWKVLDQLVELCLELANVPHDRGRDYSINFKVREASGGTVTAVSPFDGRPDLWMRAMRSWSSTADLRHSLVHRRLIVDRAIGELAGVARPGESAPTPLSVDQQSAFLRVAVGVAEAVVGGELPTRRADQVSWALDQLTALHGQPAFGTSSAHGVVPVVVVRPPIGASNELALDFGDISSRARRAVGGVSQYDLEVHMPDGRILTGPLEDAPEGPGAFSVDDPPTWLRWA